MKNNKNNNAANMNKAEKNMIKAAADGIGTTPTAEQVKAADAADQAALTEQVKADQAAEQVKAVEQVKAANDAAEKVKDDARKADAEHADAAANQADAEKAAEQEKAEQERRKASDAAAVKVVTKKAANAPAPVGMDYFKADRKLPADVAAFYNGNLSAAVRSIRFRKDMEREQATLERAISNAAPDADVDAIRNQGLKAMETIRKNYDDARKAAATYRPTDADKALKAAFNKADNDADRKDAIRKWFDCYHMPTTDKGLSEYVDAMRGRGAITGRALLRAVYDKADDLTTDRKDVIKVFYAVLASHMIKAGTLKLGSLPADVAAIFKADDAKKAAKKAAKK